jgi:hypothetical protein
MWAPKPAARRHRRPSITQAGATAIEFALLSLVFFTFVFSIIEVARLMYVYNTLQEVTRRAAAGAANVYASDTANLAKIRQAAVFRDSPGELVLAPPITDNNIRFSYLNFDLTAIEPAAWPSSAANNRAICMANPHAANCIRFVQAQVCDDADTDACSPVRSAMLFPLIDLRVLLHKAVTIVPIESFGYVQGTPPDPPPPCGC